MANSAEKYQKEGTRADKHGVRSLEVSFVFQLPPRGYCVCKSLTLRRLMSYIYIYIYMEHPFLMFLDHTQRRSTVGRTPLDE